MHVLIRMGEVILATVVVIFVVYKLALSLGMVPEDFSPLGIAKSEYAQFKQDLQEHAAADDLRGDMAQVTLKSLNHIEAYIAARQAKLDATNAITVECRENSIFRFFMYMGDNSPDNQKCTESNMQETRAISNITTSEKPQAATNSAATETSNGVAPHQGVVPQHGITPVGGVHSAPRSD